MRNVTFLIYLYFFSTFTLIIFVPNDVIFKFHPTNESTLIFTTSVPDHIMTVQTLSA